MFLVSVVYCRLVLIPGLLSFRTNACSIYRILNNYSAIYRGSQKEIGIGPIYIYIYRQTHTETDKNRDIGRVTDTQTQRDEGSQKETNGWTKTGSCLPINYNKHS